MFTSSIFLLSAIGLWHMAVASPVSVDPASIEPHGWQPKPAHYQTSQLNTRDDFISSASDAGDDQIAYALRSVLQSQTPAGKPPDSAAAYYLYVWCSPDNKASRDFLAAFALPSLPSRSPPSLVNLVPVPTRGNEAHHIGVSRDGRTAFAGGLLSFRRHQDPNFFFDLTNRRQPRLVQTSRPTRGMAADACVALANGGFLITMMGGVATGRGGRVVEYDQDFRLVAEYPEREADVPTGFHPHGIAIEESLDVMITSDFVDPHTTLRPSRGVQAGNTVRIWDLGGRRIRATLVLTPQLHGGIMDVVFLKSPTTCPGCAVATSTGDGKLYLIDTQNATFKVVYDAQDTNVGFHTLVVNNTGTRMWVTATFSGHIYMFDTTDPNNLKLMGKLAIGAYATPHYLALGPDQTTLIVTDYFLDEKDFGLVHFPGDKMLHFIDVSGDSMDWRREMSIDFKRLLRPLGVVNPHGVVMLQS
ncbi:hypothetical protein H4R33_002759 [Dimargaris cristalligena]|nr:hypothetical protein H4R33_002759 [Dimargaris cristalligena]